MISKKRVQCVIDLNRRLLEKVMNDRDSYEGTDMDMYFTGQINVYNRIIEDLEDLIKE